jgi:hypothetical protein
MKAGKARMVLMIWLAMFGSGWRIGIAKPIMPIHLTVIQLVHLPGISACCVAARGTSTISARALPTAAGAILRIPTTTLVFVVPAHALDSEMLVSGFLKTEAVLLFHFPAKQGRVLNILQVRQK